MTNIENIMNEIKNQDIASIAPNYKKGVLSNEEVTKIIEKIAYDIEVSKADALAGTMLLMLKGASSSGTPQTLSVDLRNNKTLAKKNIMGAYLSVTGNNYIRRLAEALAINIGEFAENFGLSGELAIRINTALKAESGEILTSKEMAWCSSFSQNIPDLAERSSERLVKLLAEDYKKRFESKKKSTQKVNNIVKEKKKKKN